MQNSITLIYALENGLNPFPHIVDISRIPLAPHYSVLIEGLRSVTGGAKIWVDTSFGGIAVIRETILNDPHNLLAAGFKPWLFYNPIGTQIACALFEIRACGIDFAECGNTSPKIMDFLNEYRATFGEAKQARILIDDNLINGLDALKNYKS